MTRTQQITLDVYEAPYFLYVNAKQRDNDSRILVVTLTDQGKEIRPDHTKDTAVFRARKPDGTCVLDPATIGEDGKITVALSAQTLAVPGDVEADIAVVNGDDILSTASFYIQVARAPLGQGIVSENEFLVMVEAAARAETAANAASEAAKLIEGMKVSASQVAAGGSPTAELTKKDGHYELDLGLVTGDKGDKGDAATVQIGTVTTGEPGSSASVKNSGTGTDAKLDFVIPQGPVGPAGGVTSVNGMAGPVQIGGRNLLLDSGRAVSNSAYRFATYNLSNGALDLQDRETVSISIKANLAEGKYITLFADGSGYNSLGSIRANDFDELGIARKAISWNRHSRPEMANNTVISIYAYPNDGDASKISTIEWIKLEHGNVATDWSPAPEDKADVPLQFDVKLPVSGWVDGSQTVTDTRFVDGYNIDWDVNVKGACIPWDGITVTDGQMVARTDIVPTTDMTWTVTRREVRRDE